MNKTFRGTYFTLTTGMLHPAVLGTIIVGTLNIGSDLLRPDRWFSVAGSVILIWYFSLDYLVTVFRYGNCQQKYGPRHFVIEVVLMIFLLWSFNVLWADSDDRYELFFLLASLQLLAIGLWNRLDDPASGWRNEWVWKVIVAGLLLLIPAFASHWIATDAARLLQIAGLLFMALLLLIYTREFCEPEFIE